MGVMIVQEHMHSFSHRFNDDTRRRATSCRVQSTTVHFSAALGSSDQRLAGVLPGQQGALTDWQRCPQTLPRDTVLPVALQVPTCVSGPGPFNLEHKSHSSGTAWSTHCPAVSSTIRSCSPRSLAPIATELLGLVTRPFPRIAELNQSLRFPKNYIICAYMCLMCSKGATNKKLWLSPLVCRRIGLATCDIWSESIWKWGWFLTWAIGG